MAAAVELWLWMVAAHFPISPGRGPETSADLCAFRLQSTPLGRDGRGCIMIILQGMGRRSPDHLSRSWKKKRPRTLRHPCPLREGAAMDKIMDSSAPWGSRDS